MNYIEYQFSIEHQPVMPVNFGLTKRLLRTQNNPEANGYWSKLHDMRKSRAYDRGSIPHWNHRSSLTRDQGNAMDAKDHSDLLLQRAGAYDGKANAEKTWKETKYRTRFPHNALGKQTYENISPKFKKI